MSLRSADWSWANSRAGGPSRESCVDSEESSFVGVRLGADTRATRTLLRGLREMRDADAVPEPFLNNHCPDCQFQQRCQARAEAIDHLSLLRGMGEAGIAKLARRGIFTITQLSYTFRPRRSGKKSPPIRAHSFALQALAIREKTIYVLGNPEVPDSPVRIHFDIEGSVERGTAYLIGMIVEDGVSERRFSFWADGEDQQEQILGDFLDLVEGYPDGHLFCYGRLRDRIPEADEEARDGRADRSGPGQDDQRLAHHLLVRLLPGLFQWSQADRRPPGLPLERPRCLRAPVHRLEAAMGAVPRRGPERTIETYNLEDCAALGAGRQVPAWDRHRG